MPTDKRTITYNSPKLFSYQKDVCELIQERGTNKTVVVKSRRQVGKSTMLSVILLFYAINYSKSKSYCLSPTLNQAKNIFNQIVELTSNSKGLVEKRNGQDLEITFVNGSTIKFLSAAMGDRLRGYSADLVVVDEAAFISDDVLPLILPWRSFHSAPMLIVSTPFVKDGFFFRFYEQGLDGKNGMISIDWTAEKYKPELDAILPPDQLELFRSQLPEKQFRCEFMGQFLDDEGMVFSGYKDLFEQTTIGNNDSLYAGIDWSLGVSKDDTVLSIINNKGQQVYWDAFNDLTPTQSIERIMSDIDPFLNQIKRIQPETNSLGGVYTDMLTKRLPKHMANKVVGFNTSNQSKNAIVTNLQKAFEDKTIRLLNIDKQTRQLGTYAAEFHQKTRTISYNAPQGLNDDCCIALMLSWDAYLNANATGVYSISTIRR